MHGSFHEYNLLQSRRQFLKTSGMGLGTAALAALLPQNAAALGGVPGAAEAAGGRQLPQPAALPHGSERVGGRGTGRKIDAKIHQANLGHKP